MVHPYIADDELYAMYPDDPGMEEFIKISVREFELLSREPLFDEYQLIRFDEL